MKMKELQDWIWVLLRLAMAWIMLWAFFDKVFGLGYATATGKSWLAGNSPTAGFLKMGTSGPLALLFQSMSGNPLVDWLFMLGLLGVGTALLLGMGMKIAGYSGALMMALIWMAGFPPQQNPFLDEHIVYILVFIGLSYSSAGEKWGLGKWWKNTELVRKFPVLR